MGLRNNTEPLKPDLFREYKSDSGYTFRDYDDKYIEKFDIELLEWELSEPLIKNDD